MTLKQRLAHAKTARLCLNCQSSHVSHLGTHVLSLRSRETDTEVEHRFRCRSCFFRWSEFV